MTTININCGCGFTTRKIEEAQKHADTNGHSLSIIGTIVPDEKEVA